MNEIKEVFEYENKFYVIKQLKYEPREIYMNRVNIILKNTKNEKNLKELEKLSILWSNVKNYKCGYSTTIMTKINNLDK